MAAIVKQPLFHSFTHTHTLPLTALPAHTNTHTPVLPTLLLSLYFLSTCKSSCFCISCCCLIARCSQLLCLAVNEWMNERRGKDTQSKHRHTDNDTDTCHMPHVLPHQTTDTCWRAYTQRTHTSTRAAARKRTTAAVDVARAAQQRANRKTHAASALWAAVKVRRWAAAAAARARTEHTARPTQSLLLTLSLLCQCHRCCCCSFAVHFVLAFGFLCVHTRTHLATCAHTATGTGQQALLLS